MTRQQALDDDTGVHPLRLTKTGAVKLYGLEKKIFLQIIMVQQGQRRLYVAQVNLGIEQHVVQFTGGVSSVGLQAADIDGVPRMT